MPELSYRQFNLQLRPGSGAEQQVRDLQRDLRRLGYLQSGIDGIFGRATSRAIKALQYDLLNNDGASRSAGGRVPVCLVDYNRGRLVDITGIANQKLIECISDMLDDCNFPQLPFAADPVAANRAVTEQIAATPVDVPIPFLLAILKQESGLKHFCEPSGRDQDNFIVVGFDANSSPEYIITSRGYGIGQFTLFHHPPTRQEVETIMLDPAKNVAKAVAELRHKYDHFVNGRTPGTQAADRLAELGTVPLRSCKYSPADSRYMADCHRCARDAGSTEITCGITPLYSGCAETYRPTKYYRQTAYENVPLPRNIGCDWPYAARRYNGSGMNSYHYQARILKNLAEQPDSALRVGGHSAM